MCGGCGAAPHDEMAPWISGTRRRAAVAAAAAEQAPGLRVRAVDRAWTVSERTGRVTVCRTFEQLLNALDRPGTDRPAVRSALLRAAESAPAPG